MPADPRLEPREFGAPVGRRVRMVTSVCLAMGGVILLLNLALAWHEGQADRRFWPLVIAGPLALLFMGAIAEWSRIAGYRLTADELEVRRRWKTNRFALRGLERVEADAEALRGAWKTIGNDGLGGITGRFRSTKLGRFEAFVSDARCAVVLRWPDRCLVVSPERPGEFVDSVLSRGRARR